MSGSDLLSAIEHYKANYVLLDAWSLSPLSKVKLGDPSKRQCRFCRRSYPAVTFRKVAHGIPEAIGNRSLTTFYECDDCNDLFGSGIENDFGNWSKPLRTLARIRGKGGVPTLKGGADGGWRIQYDEAGFLIQHAESDPPYEVDEAHGKLTLTLTRDTFTPVAVLKAFVKMGLAVLPESEIGHFDEAVAWVRSLDHTVSFVSEFPVLYTFVPGVQPESFISLQVLRRKSAEAAVPYAFIVLSYGNEVFQVFLPCPTQDRHINGKRLGLYHFPLPQDFEPSPFGAITRTVLDLTGRSPVRGETTRVRLSYDTTEGEPPRRADA